VKNVIGVVILSTVGFLFGGGAALASGSAYTPHRIHYSIETHCPSMKAKLEYGFSWNRMTGTAKPSLSTVTLTRDGKTDVIDISKRALPNSLPASKRLIIDRVGSNCYEDKAITFHVFFVDQSKPVGTVPGTVSLEEVTYRVYLTVYKDGNTKIYSIPRAGSKK